MPILPYCPCYNKFILLLTWPLTLNGQNTKKGLRKKTSLYTPPPLVSLDRTLSGVTRRKVCLCKVVFMAVQYLKFNTFPIA